MKRWTVAAVIAAAGIALAGCAASEGTATVEPVTQGCHLIATAQDAINDASNAYRASGKTAGGSQAVRDAFDAYPVLISQAAELSASFQDAADNAALYVQASKARDYKSAGIYHVAIDNTISECRAIGVEMPISELVGS